MWWRVAELGLAQGTPSTGAEVGAWSSLQSQRGQMGGNYVWDV